MLFSTTTGRTCKCYHHHYMYLCIAFLANNGDSGKSLRVISHTHSQGYLRAMGRKSRFLYAVKGWPSAGNKTTTHFLIMYYRQFSQIVEIIMITLNSGGSTQIDFGRPRSNFLHSRAIFRKLCWNNRLVIPLRTCSPFSLKSWIRYCWFEAMWRDVNVLKSATIHFTFIWILRKEFSPILKYLFFLCKNLSTKVTKTQYI